MLDHKLEDAMWPDEPIAMTATPRRTLDPSALGDRRGSDPWTATVAAPAVATLVHRRPLAREEAD